MIRTYLSFTICGENFAVNVNIYQKRFSILQHYCY